MPDIAMPAFFFPLNPISPEPKATKHSDRETLQVGPATPPHHSVHSFAAPEKMKTVT